MAKNSTFRARWRALRRETPTMLTSGESKKPQRFRAKSGDRMGSVASFQRQSLVRVGFVGIAFMTAVVVSGCSVDVVHATPSPSISTQVSAPPVSVPPVTASATPQNPGSAKPSGTKTAAPNTGPVTENDLARRSYYADKVEIVTGCPTGAITLERTNTVTRITEYCEDVTIEAPYVTLIAERIGTLTVRDGASSGHFIVRQVSSATLEAPYSFLYWDGGNPEIDVSGYQSVAKPNPVPEG